MNQLRTLLITGASSGIGHTVAIQALQAGHRVIGIGRQIDKMPQHENLTAHALDLSDLDKLPQRLADILKNHATIDGLICCAGKGRFGSLEEFSPTQIRKLMDLNFTATAFVVRAFLPALKRQTNSDIIVIGSEAALNGKRQGSIYCASKFALRGFTQALRDECGRQGVRVTLINPGMINTAFFNELNFAPGAAEENYLIAEDVATTVMHVLAARPHCVFDEINLSPATHVVRSKTNKMD